MRLLVIAAAMLLTAACAESSSPSPTPARDPAEVAADVPLALDEMPGGWEILPEGGDLGSEVQLSAECNIYDLGVSLPGALATARSEAFIGQRDQQMQTFGAVYASESEAQAAVDGTAGLVERCGDEFKEVLKQAAKDQIEALGIDIGFLGRIDVALEERDATSAADESAGYRIFVEVSAVGQSQSFSVDFLVLRAGRVVAALQYATFGSVDESDEASIEATLLSSAKQAESG